VLVVAIRVELCGTAIVFWGDTEDRRIDKTEDLDDFQGDCNKEKYVQRVVLLEQGKVHNGGADLSFSTADIRLANPLTYLLLGHNPLSVARPDETPRT